MPTARAEKAFEMLGHAELVPLDYWGDRSFVWLTVRLEEFRPMTPPSFWERCDTEVCRQTVAAGLAPAPAQAVAVQIVGDDGSHATAWAVCAECLERMGHSG